jgi:hypothetical protein
LKVHWDFNSQSGSSFGSLGFIPSHSLALLGAWNVISSSLLACTFTTPCFGHKTKARVATIVFHKNFFEFFVQFLGTTFENSLLIDDKPHKSLINLPFSAIFFETFYKLHNDVNYLFQTFFPYLESLHLSKMQVHKFVKLNPFGSIIVLCASWWPSICEIDYFVFCKMWWNDL